MSKLLEQIQSKVFHRKGADARTVINAEKWLGLRFSSEFRNYLMDYGAASFGSHEFMGLGGDAYVDVVEETLRERRNTLGFTKDCYVVENLGIDGILILQNEDGQGYEFSPIGMKRIFLSMKEYILSCES